MYNGGKLRQRTGGCRAFHVPRIFNAQRTNQEITCSHRVFPHGGHSARGETSLYCSLAEKWVYCKDRTGSEGEDCAWVDGVEWIQQSSDAIPPVAANAAPSAVTDAIESSGFADADGVKAAIGGSAEEYAKSDGRDAVVVSYFLSKRIRQCGGSRFAILSRFGYCAIGGFLIPYRLVLESGANRFRFAGRGARQKRCGQNPGQRAQIRARKE